jgi:hypothetical protein
VPSVVNTEFDWLALRAQDMTLIVRIRANAMTSNCGIFMTLSGNPFRLYFLNGTQIRLECQGGTTMTSPAATVPPTGDISLMMRRKGGVTSFYISTAEGSPFVFLNSLATSGSTTPVTLGPVIIGWNGSTRIAFGRIRVWKTALPLGQCEFVRAQLVADWPDASPVILDIDGSNAGSTFTPDGLYYNSIPTTGELVGTMIPAAQLKPAVLGVNLKRAPHFTGGEFAPLALASIVPFLWVEADASTVFTGNVVPGGTSPPAVTISGTNSAQFPACFAAIVLPGALGVATIRATFDGGVTWQPEQISAATVNFGPFTVSMPAGTYLGDNTWDAVPETMLDMTGQANHMGRVGQPRMSPGFKNGRAAFLPSASGYFLSGTFTAARAVAGKMLMVLVGNSGPSPGNKIPFGGVNFMRDARLDGFARPSLVSTVVANIVGALTPNTDFLWFGFWDGAASTITVRQTALADLTGTVNPGDPAALPLTVAGFGAHASGVQTCDGYKLAALFLAEVPGAISASDLDYLLQGFALRFGFDSTLAADVLKSDLIAPSDLTFLHNGTQNYQISMAVAWDPTTGPSPVALECVSSGGYGVRLLFDPVADTLTASIYGTAGTFSGAINVGTAYGFGVPMPQMIIELQFSAAKIDVFVNELLVGTITPAAFTFATAAQDNPLIYGKGRGFSLCETIVRSDFTSQAAYLRGKWFPNMWAEPPIDVNGYAPIDANGFAPVG